MKLKQFGILVSSLYFFVSTGYAAQDGAEAPQARTSRLFPRPLHIDTAHLGIADEAAADAPQAPKAAPPVDLWAAVPVDLRLELPKKASSCSKLPAIPSARPATTRTAATS